MSGYGLSMCAVHGKKRGSQNLQEVAPGQFVCRPSMECQAVLGQSMGAPQQQQHGYGMQQQQQQQHHQMDLGLGGMNYGAPSMNSFGGLGGGLGMGGGIMGGMGGMGTMPINPSLMGGSAFSGASNPVVQKQFCCIHKKERMTTSLVSVAPGAKGLRCRSDDECKMGQGQIANQSSETMVECSLHGKSRSTTYLVCQDDGSWRCKAESECISTVGSEKQPCSQHNKFRAIEVMQQDSDGKWTCKPGSKCKGTGSNVSRSPGVPYARPATSGNSICSLHNKKRGTKYLVPHASIHGALTCVPGNECK